MSLLEGRRRREPGGNVWLRPPPHPLSSDSESEASSSLQKALVRSSKSDRCKQSSPRVSSRRVTSQKITPDNLTDEEDGSANTKLKCDSPNAKSPEDPPDEGPVQARRAWSENRSGDRGIRKEDKNHVSSLQRVVRKSSKSIDRNDTRENHSIGGKISIPNSFRRALNNRTEDVDPLLEMDEQEQYEKYQEELYQQQFLQQQDTNQYDSSTSSQHRQFNLSPLYDFEMTEMKNKRKSGKNGISNKKRSFLKQSNQTKKKQTDRMKHSDSHYRQSSRASHKNGESKEMNDKKVMHQHNRERNENDSGIDGDSNGENILLYDDDFNNEYTGRHGAKTHEAFYNLRDTDNDEENVQLNRINDLDSNWSESEEDEDDDDDEERPLRKTKRSKLLTRNARHSIISQFEQCINRTLLIAIALVGLILARDRTSWWKNHKQLQLQKLGQDSDRDPMSIYNSNDDDSTQTRDHDPLNKYSQYTAGERISKRPAHKSLNHGFMDETYEHRPAAENSGSTAAISSGVKSSGLKTENNEDLDEETASFLESVIRSPSKSSGEVSSGIDLRGQVTDIVSEVDDESYSQEVISVPPPPPRSDYLPEEDHSSSQHGQYSYMQTSRDSIMEPTVHSSSLPEENVELLNDTSNDIIRTTNQGRPTPDDYSSSAEPDSDQPNSIHVTSQNELFIKNDDNEGDDWFSVVDNEFSTTPQGTLLSPSPVSNHDTLRQNDRPTVGIDLDVYVALRERKPSTVSPTENTSKLGLKNTGASLDWGRFNSSGVTPANPNVQPISFQKQQLQPVEKSFQLQQTGNGVDHSPGNTQSPISEAGGISSFSESSNHQFPPHHETNRNESFYYPTVATAMNHDHDSFEQSLLSTNQSFPPQQQLTQHETSNESIEYRTQYTPSKVEQYPLPQESNQPQPTTSPMKNFPNDILYHTYDQNLPPTNDESSSQQKSIEHESVKTNIADDPMSNTAISGEAFISNSLNSKHADEVKATFQDSFYRWNHPFRPTETGDDTGKDIPVFWRIPRSAGSTVEAIMTYCFGMTLASALGAGHDSDESLGTVTVGAGGQYVNVDVSNPAGIQKAKSMNLGRSNMMDVISTPFLYDIANIFEGIPEAGKCFTMLRHPVERAIALYHLYQIDENNPNTAKYRGLTIDQYSESVEENNWMVRFLANKRGGSLTWHDLEAAKEVFGRKCLVGLLDKVEESLQRYEHFFGWDSRVANAEKKEVCIHDYLANGDKRNSHPTYVGTNAWEVLRKKNEYDVLLYEYARGLYGQQSTIYQ
mmetsp:Transcript_9229/g.19204  ORF Transcript_9229/g.19204 Transcript_9229/m.19204 type:complete len:1272 (+) Transcript_9229:90-3905(+)